MKRKFGFIIILYYILVSHELFAAVDLDKDFLNLDTTFSLGVSYPKFTQMKYFDNLFGKPNLFPHLRGGYLLRFAYLSFGIEGSLGYFKQKGYVTKNYNSESGALPTKSTGRDSLAFLPYQILVTTQLSPSWQYFSLKGWYGYEEFYYEDTRDLDSSSSAMIQPYVNKGWGSNLVFGGSLNISLNFLDEKSIYSMQKTLGFGQIYLSPFIEISTKLNNQKTFISQQKITKLSLARQAIGIGFNFESIN